MALDRIDHGIIDALQNDGRISNKMLAAKVGLAPSSCLERVRKLEQQGVLKGYRAEVSLAARGVRLQAIVYVELGRHRGDEVNTFDSHIRTFSEVVAVFNVAGRWDYLLHVAVPDVERLKSFSQDALASRNEVRRVETSLVFEHHARGSLPLWDEATD